MGLELPAPESLVGYPCAAGGRARRIFRETMGPAGGGTHRYVGGVLLGLLRCLLACLGSFGCAAGGLGLEIGRASCRERV